MMKDNRFMSAQTSASAQLGAIQKATKYMVLRFVGSGELDTGRWEALGEAEGYNPRDAIKKVTKSEGTYVAVPVRSWSPTTRTKKPTTVDVWS